MVIQFIRDRNRISFVLPPLLLDLVGCLTKTTIKRPINKRPRQECQHDNRGHERPNGYAALPPIRLGLLSLSLFRFTRGGLSFRVFLRRLRFRCLMLARSSFLFLMTLPSLTLLTQFLVALSFPRNSQPVSARRAVIDLPSVA